MIVKLFTGIHSLMVIKSPDKPVGLNRIVRARYRVATAAPVGPTLADLRKRAEEALSEPEGLDFGSLSRADRDAELARRFGI